MIFDSSPIDEFASESAPASKDASRPATAAADASRQESRSAPESTSPQESRPARQSISLEEVTSRGTSVSWEEGVAIVEELCSLLLPADRAPLPIPSLDDILINADGTIGLPSRVGGERGPDAAGRLLHALLSTTNVPMALRLFVTQASTPRAHASLNEFAAMLAYFGKPARAEMIQAVYARHMVALGQKPVTLPKPVSQTPVVPKPAAARQAEPPKPAFTPPKKVKKIPAWFRVAFPAGATAGLAGVVLLWAWAGPADDGVVAGAETVAGVVSESAVAPLGASGHGVGPETGATAVQLASAQAVPPTAVSPASRARAAVPARVPPPRAAPVVAAATAAANAAPGLTRASAPVAAASIVEAPPPAAAAVARTNRPLVVVPPSASDTIYSSADADVLPPVLIDQALPKPLLTIDRSTATENRMEILVNADGSVERVRMVAGPGRMPDMMLLSGAKVWQFTPAVKNGEAVRYLTVLSWTAFP